MNDYADNDAEPRQIKEFDADFYQAMIDTLHEGAFVIQNKCFKLVNQAFCRLTGCHKLDLIGEPFDRFIYPQNLAIVFDESTEKSSVTRLKTPIIKHRINANSPEYHLVAMHISGKTTPIEINSQHFIDSKGQLYQIANVRKKLVEQELNQALRDAESELKLLIERLPGVYFQSDNNGKIIKVSHHTAALLGFDKKQMLGKNLSEIYVSPDEHAHGLAKILENKGDATEIQANFRCQDSTSIRVSCTGYAKYNKNRDFVGIEIVARQRPTKSVAIGRHSSDAIRDPLTQLINQLTFAEHLSKSIRGARRHQAHLWVLYINLQNLSTIDDQFGSKVSNSCLVHFSQRLQSFFRDTDIVARVSDDCFAVLLDDFTKDLALNSLIGRLQDVMNKKTPIVQYPYGFTFNIGTANFPQDGINSGDLIEHAESMMYKFKFSQNSRSNSLNLE